MSTVDIALIQAYLANVQVALQNYRVSQAEALLECTQKLLLQPPASLSSLLPVQMSIGIGLDTGITRQGRPNEDFVFASKGVNMKSQETYGLFVVADGMGGHANGQIASRLATETVVNTLLPFLHLEYVQISKLGELLRDAVSLANTIIYEQNQKRAASQLLDQMGTTITATIVFGPHTYIANVGDSRAYLYRLGVGLHVITCDHSIVAKLVASGAITSEDVYTHPERNKIFRCLGADPNVEVDFFYRELQDGDILLLCTDGIWEMTRDHFIEQVLASSWLSAEKMTERLIQLALQGGGKDNIGLILSQMQMDVSSLQTIPIHLYAAVS